MSEKIYVAIIKDGETVPERLMGPMNQRRADRVEDGANINLNHAEWHTEQVTESELPESWKALLKQGN